LSYGCKTPNKADIKIDGKKKALGNDPLILTRAKEAENFLKKVGLPGQLALRLKETA
jgi:hypothetical protein